MRCSEIEDRLTAYLEDLLQNEERDMIEKHCAECGNCRHSLEALQKTKDLLKGLDEIEPPPWLTENIMARIYEKEEKKGWLQWFFLPLRVKVPIQALAMIFVVVLSVYLYRSTTPEMARLDRPQHVPRVTGAGSSVEKTEAPQGKEARQDPKHKEKKAAPPVEKAPERPAQKAPGRSVPAQEGLVPGSKPGIAGMPPAPAGNGAATDRVLKKESAHSPAVPPYIPAEKSAASDHALKKESARPGAVPPPPAKIEHYKTREMAARDERSSENRTAATGVSQETPSRITVTSGDPSDTARKTRRIMTSLRAAEIRERTQNTSVIISCSINPGSILELKNRMADVALLDESRTRIITGQTAPQFIEVVILKDPQSP